MNDMPRRRLTDHLPASPTLVGTGTDMIGEIKCAGDLMVSGSVEGKAQVGGSLTLADTGHWQGDIIAATAIIAGEIQGSITVTDRLEIRKSARIRGTIRAKTIAIATGAVIDGDMAVTSGGPVVHFEEKRNT